MKKIALLLTGIAVTLAGYSQDQTVNGKLTISEDVFVGMNVADKWEGGTKLYLRGTDQSGDQVWMQKYTKQKEYTDLRINIGDGITHQDRFIIGTTEWDTKEWNNLFVVRMDGNVGIRVAQPKSALDVNGTIRAKEVKIEATGWADFVFQPEYQLKPLSEVENHIKEHKHLPDIPSEAEVKENGISVGEMQTKLLQKVEELTLYVIEQNKKIEELKEENKEIKKENQEMKRENKEIKEELVNLKEK